MNRSEAGKLGAIKSKIIAAEQKELRIKSYLLHPNKCAQCKKAIQYSKKNNKFCSQSCAACYNNADKGKYRKLKQKQCPCGNYFSSKDGNLHNKFCPTCIANKKHLHSKTNIDDCKTDHLRRKLLIKKHGIICFVCKNTKWNEQIIPIEIDHIDGNPNNNIESNLRLICPNCHAQTTTYKGKNKGNGRFKRMERYNNDKSF